MEPVLTDAQVEAWRTEGYVAVPGVLDAEELRQIREEASAYFPVSRNGSPTPAKDKELPALPYAGDGLNSIPFHPRIAGAVAQLLGTQDIRLTQSMIRATYGDPAAGDQSLHQDYKGLLTPPRYDLGQMPVIVYLTDVGLDNAPTYVVSRRHSDAASVPAQTRSLRESPAAGQLILDKGADPELYEHEVPNIVSAGTVLFYTMLTWHRASASHDPNAYRLVHHTHYRRADQEWAGFTLWSAAFWHNENGQRCMERLTPRQRELIGIPAPGHPFWTTETIDYFAARYPGADTEPYRRACRTAAGG